MPFALAVICALAAIIMAGVALKRARELEEHVRQLTFRLRKLETQKHGPDADVGVELHPIPEPPVAFEPPPAAPEPARPQRQAPVLLYPVDDGPLPSPSMPPQSTRKVPPATAYSGGWSRFEDTIGRHWMTWAGVLALILASGFFVKYAIDAGWIGPAARVIMGAVAGIALLAAGERFISREMRPLGQGLIGGGMAILYISIYAATEYYDLIGQAPAFGGMTLISVAVLALALRHDARAIAVLAVVGGFLTPVLCSTGKDARDVLFGYLAIIDVAVLAIAFVKQWRALAVIACIGTGALFTAWFFSFYSPAAQNATLRWLGVFYTVFLILPFAYTLHKRKPATVGQFAVALGVAFVTFAYAWGILHLQNRLLLGQITLGMSACYLLLAVLTSKRVKDDAAAIFTLVGLSITFLTITVPLLLKGDGITIAWSAEAVMLLYLGYRFDRLLPRLASVVVLVLAVARLWLMHFPLHPGAFAPFFNSEFLTVLCVPTAAGACAVIHRFRKAERSEVDSIFAIINGIGAGALALVLTQMEVESWFDLYSRWQQLSLGFPIKPQAWFRVVLWTFGALAFLAAGVWLRSLAARLAGLGALLLATVLAAGMYDFEGGHHLFINIRFAAAMILVLGFASYAAVIRSRKDSTDEERSVVPRLLAWALCVGLLVLLSKESHSYFMEKISYGELAARMALTIVWALYAVALLTVGFWRGLFRVRLAALGLFAITCIKLLFVDLAGLEQGYRIISFVAAGVLMIGASYLYHRVAKIMEDADKK